MTDEQLRAMARRVLGLVTDIVLDGRPCYVGHRDSLSFTQPVDDIEAAAVAILREELGKAETKNYAGVADLLERWESEDDPTQTIVIDT